MICQQCGTENAPGDKFCEHCGAPLASGPAMDDGGAATMVGAPPSSATLVRTDDPSQTFQLGNRVVVGRLDSCDITVNDKSVSREHARLSQLPGGYVVEDLGSTNGTLVNGERITEPVILRLGDSVTFGSIDFQFEEAGGFAVPGVDSGSTQPFQYRPPEQAEAPAEQTAVPAEPSSFPTPVAEPVAQPEPSPFPTPVAQPEPSPFPTPVAPPFTPGPAPFASAASEPQAAAADEAPAFEFPPLQPFSAPEPEPIAPPITPEPELITPPAEPQTVQSVAAPPPAEPPAAPPVQEQSMSPEPAPVSPVPPEPAVAATPAPSPTPAPSASTGLASGDMLSDDAVAAAAHLNDLVQALAQRAAEAEARAREAEARARELEGHGASREAVAAALSSAHPASVGEAQLTSLQEMLDQLMQNPRDIEVLMQVGRQSGDLATVVREYGQLRETMDRVSQAAG